MANITGQELIDRLSDILLSDVRDDLNLAYEKVTFEVPGGGSISVGEYFTFSSSTTNYYVYIEVDSSTGNDPGVPAKTGIKVDILSGDSSGTVAENIVTAVALVATELTDIDNISNIITITSDSHTNTTQLVDVSVGLTDITLSDPKGMFDPNHLSTPGVPESSDKVLIKSAIKKTLIETVNKLAIDLDNLSESLQNNLNQQFGVIGDFVSDPTKKTDMETAATSQGVASDLLEVVISVYKDLHGTDLGSPVSVTDHVKSLIFPVTSSDINIDAGLDMNSTVISELASGGITNTNASNISDVNFRKSIPRRYTVKPGDVSSKFITLSDIDISASSIDPSSVSVVIDGGVMQFSDLLYDSQEGEEFEYSVGDSTGNFYIRADATVDPSDSNDLTDCSNLIEDGDKLIITFSEK